MTDEGCTGEGRGRGHTYTEAEVKVLTETATRVALELGRREALEEALSYVEAEAKWQVALMKGDPEEQWGHSVQRLNVIANCLRSVMRPPLPSQATSDATSGVPGHPEVSEAVRSPQEPRERS